MLCSMATVISRREKIFCSQWSCVDTNKIKIWPIYCIAGRKGHNNVEIWSWLLEYGTIKDLRTFKPV